MLRLISFALPFNFGVAKRSNWAARQSVTTAPRNNGPVVSKIFSSFTSYFRRTGGFDAVGLWRTTACFPAAPHPMVGRPTTAITQHPLRPGTNTKGAATGERSKNTKAFHDFHWFGRRNTHLPLCYCYDDYVFPWHTFQKNQFKG